MINLMITVWYSRLSLIGTRIREISVKEYKVNHVKKSKNTAVPTTFSLVSLAVPTTFSLVALLKGITLDSR